jgi:hypothetical protein
MYSINLVTARITWMLDMLDIDDIALTRVVIDRIKWIRGHDDYILVHSRR